MDRRALSGLLWRGVAAGSVVLALWAPRLGAQEDVYSTIVVCNKGTAELLAVALKQGNWNVLRLEGWWSVRPGRCTTVHSVRHSPPSNIIHLQESWRVSLAFLRRTRSGAVVPHFGLVERFAPDGTHGKPRILCVPYPDTQALSAVEPRSALPPCRGGTAPTMVSASVYITGNASLTITQHPMLEGDP